MRSIGTLRNTLRPGMVIPAHPLALTSNRRLDERRQRALTRYYLASGAGGVAVGVHTTQFKIHDSELGLYGPVLEIAEEEVSRFRSEQKREPVKVAGIVGPTEQAVKEASLAREIGYDCGLLSLASMRDSTVRELIEHAQAVSEVIPLFGFYLQPAVGGLYLSYDFWRSFFEIESVVAVKIAPFDRYYTNDVIRALLDSGRREEISLYTGNDDNIIADLLTPFSFDESTGKAPVRMVGGLLGHWAFWTSKSVELLGRIQETISGGSLSFDWLKANAAMTDANSAVFDAANRFRGCIPGIHEVLRRQGLLRGTWCLNALETLSPGQAEEIDRVCRAYPEFSDDEFVQEHLDTWLSG